MTDTKKSDALRQAEQALADFLKAHPAMYKQQKKLDQYLKRCSNSYERMLLLRELMKDNMERLDEQWRILQNEVNKLKEGSENG